MDFTKYVALLEENALYFSGLRQLADNDPFEGYLSWPSIDEYHHPRLGGSPDESPEERFAAAVRLFQDLRSDFCVSCWHRSPHESAAMWRLYLQSGEGIAVRSTVGRLMAAVGRDPDPVYIGDVRYIDYRSDRIPSANVLHLALHKRRSFEHEREIRALKMGRFNGEGTSVPVDLHWLIDAVFVAPTAPAWIRSLVERVTRRYGVNAHVHRSDLRADPPY